jgi:D-sedoheptulose 7-phosphate isomerase
MTNSITANYCAQLTKALTFIEQQPIDELVTKILALRQKKGVLYLCGNGGSAANAIHITNDFIFGAEPKGNSIRAEALSANSSVLTCLGNDIGYENIFSHQLKVKANSGDMLIVLSGSGNSANILSALEQANVQGLTTVAILGFDGGKAKTMADIVFHFDINDMQISEDLQVIIGHIVMKSLYVSLSKLEK